MSEHTRGTGLSVVRVPPAVVLAACALLMALAARMVPELRIEFPGRAPVAALVMLLGGTVSLLGVCEFRRARTTSNPLHPDAATALVDTGIYAWSRNPMYLGFATALLGWALFLAHPLPLLVVPGFVLWMNRYQIEREERALRALFGEAFDEYCARVGRWLNIRPRRSA